MFLDKRYVHKKYRIYDVNNQCFIVIFNSVPLNNLHAQLLLKYLISGFASCKQRAVLKIAELKRSF